MKTVGRYDCLFIQLTCDEEVEDVKVLITSQSLSAWTHSDDDMGQRHLYFCGSISWLCLIQDLGISRLR